MNLTEKNLSNYNNNHSSKIMSLMNIFKKINYENLNIYLSVAACWFMASFYVISLYLWSKQNRFNRNDPEVIKRRFISVIITSILSVILIYFLGSNQPQSSLVKDENFQYIHIWIGFRFDLNNLVKSIFVSIFLTMLLFAGPLLQNFVHGSVQHALKMPNKLEAFNDLCFWRNYILSPFTEEFVFRSCMIPLLIPHLGITKSVFITPLFFGMAHLHHIIEGYFVNDQALKSLCLQHLFQFSYTYVFGAYSSFLFIRTGNFFASFLSHSFCNIMGFPNFVEIIYEHDGITRIVLIVAYITGCILFFCLLFTLTVPLFFDNKIFDKYN